MLHWYCKAIIILRKIKNVKETIIIIVRWSEYVLLTKIEIIGIFCV